MLLEFFFRWNAAGAAPRVGDGGQQAILCRDEGNIARRQSYAVYSASRRRISSRAIVLGEIWSNEHLKRVGQAGRRRIRSLSRVLPAWPDLVSSRQRP